VPSKGILEPFFVIFYFFVGNFSLALKKKNPVLNFSLHKKSS